MKKFLCFITALLMISGLFACSPDKTAELQLPENIIPKEERLDFLRYTGNESILDIQEINTSNTLEALCSTYKFTYSCEGVSVKAYISIPADCNEDNPYKCLLYNRGGNSRLGLLTDIDTAEISVAVDRIVIASQYRGADGSTAKDEFGGADLKDVIKLVDLCENTFDFADMTDFCSVGVSRGGMMTYMLARADERIDRIIAISAVSDLIKSYEEREDMRQILDYSIGGSPEEYPAQYENRSAICWADEINIPVLMIHSKRDKQVSYSQAEALKEAFDKNGIPCTLITHKDNVHGLHSEDIDKIALWLDNFDK